MIIIEENEVILEKHDQGQLTIKWKNLGSIPGIRGESSATRIIN